MPDSARTGGKGPRSYGSAKRGNSARKRAPKPAGTKSITFGDGSPRWTDATFFLQIERCGGVAQQSFSAFSVRLEEDLYEKKALALKEDIDSFFQGSLEVLIVEVPTLYALEVRVMHDECHPRHGSPIVGEEAMARGAKTLCSKVADKKWPKAEDIYEQLQEFTRIPVTFLVLCKEQPPGVYIPGGVSGDEQFPLDNTTFRVLNSTGKEYRFHTDSEGRVEEVLYPGKFSLWCEEGSIYDRLDPGTIEVPSLFRPLKFTLMAKMKKQCTLEVVDHLNRPYPRFPLRIQPRRRSINPDFLEVLTKANGRVKARLGAGLHIANYGGPEEDPASMPVESLAQDLEVLDVDAVQTFRVVVTRRRFLCEIALRTRFNEPVRRCPFTIRSGRRRSQKPLASGVSSNKGVAAVELPVGKLHFMLEPEGTSAFVPLQFELQVSENGEYEPRSCQVETKSVNVNLRLITPYGEPAPDCEFELRARFNEDGTLSEDSGLSFCTDASGQVTVAIELFEPFIFSVSPSGRGSEYMAQELSFLTDRQSLTIVVNRSLLGMIGEETVVFVVDASGSMQDYMEDVKSAVNLALIQQFHKTRRRFNILTFTDYQVEFSDRLVDATPKNVEDAMRFCQYTQAGGASNLAAALRLAFKFKDVEAIYLITDGESEVTEDLLTQVQVQYLGHPLRPRVYTVGINCIPGGTKHRALQSLAQLTAGRFRAPCLEQDTSHPLTAGIPRGAKAKGLGLELLDNHYATTMEETSCPTAGARVRTKKESKSLEHIDQASVTTDEDTIPDSVISEPEGFMQEGMESTFRMVGFRA